MTGQELLDSSNPAVGKEVPPPLQVRLACRGTGFSKSEINDMMLAYEIARQRSQQMTQVKKEKDDKEPDDPSGDPSGDGNRLDECVAFIQGFLSVCHF